MARRIGVFGGTFNPPHNAHMMLAEAAVENLALDHVLLVPAKAPPHKPVPDDPGAAMRFELTELAAAGDERLVVSDIELSRDGPSYTVDTLRALHESEPEAELLLIIGGDMAIDFPRWHEPAEIARLATLAVVERGSFDRSAIAGALMRFADARVKLFSMPRCDISSTEVRARLARGLPVRHWVPRPVADEIEQLGIYGGAG